MMNSSLTFDFEENPIRIVCGEDGNLWFVAADVCRVLEITNVSQACDDLEDDEKGISITDTLGGPQRKLTVSESGLYSLVFKSRKPEARKFRRWVTKEVLPAIRKTGRYSMESQFQPTLLRMGDMERLEAVQVFLFEAMALFVAGKLTTRRLNAMTKLAGRIHEGLDRQWSREGRVSAKEQEKEDILSLIDKMLWPEGTGEPWEGKAIELDKLIAGDAAPTRCAARKLLTYPSAMGHALAQIQKASPERVSRRILGGYTLWRVNPPDGAAKTDLGTAEVANTDIRSDEKREEVGV